MQNPPGAPGPEQPGSTWGATPPGPGGPVPPTGGGQPEWLSHVPGPGRRQRGSRGVVLGVVAAVVALLVGGGAFAAYSFLSGGGSQPADALPDTTLAYIRVDLDPSASQKVSVVRLLRRVPQFEQLTGISSDRDDLRRRLIEALLSDSGRCQDLSYDQDIEPWIGNRAAIAVVAIDGKPQPVATVQVSDASAAADAVASLQRCSGETSPAPGVEFVGDYMLLAADAEVAAQVAKDAEASPLTQSEAFTGDMDRLGEQGVASFWVDVDAVLSLPESATASAPEQLRTAIRGIHSYFGALRAGSDYLEMAVQVRSDVAIGTETANPVVDLPGSTLTALSVSNGGDYVDRHWSELQSLVDEVEPGRFQQQVADIEQATGLMLPADLHTFLGDNLTVAVDASDVVADASQAPDLSRLDVGVRFTTDPAELTDLLSRVQAQLSEAGIPVTFATAETADGVVVASDQAYADTLAESGDLGSSAAFTTAVPDAASASSVAYVDLDQVHDIATGLNSGDSGERDDWVSTIEPMRAVGLAVRDAGDGYTAATLRLTFD